MLSKAIYIIAVIGELVLIFALLYIVATVLKLIAELIYKRAEKKRREKIEKANENKFKGK
jgi:Na+-transporting methylmalonyl-CoA/oxaloacetate decarboxylase gamma subunit